MTPIDYRNTTFAEIQGRVEGDRAKVLMAWQDHGPCTTQELADRSGISVLSVRPRTTELFQMGFVLHHGGTRGAGIYAAATPQEAAAHYQKHRIIATTGLQTELGLTIPRTSYDAILGGRRR